MEMEARMIFMCAADDEMRERGMGGGMEGGKGGG